MAKETGVLFDRTEQKWVVDKWFRGTRIRGRFASEAEAIAYKVHRTEQIRKQVVFGERPVVLFGEAAARFVQEEKGRDGFVTDLFALKAVVPFLSETPIDQIDDEALKPFIDARKAGTVRTSETRAPRPVKNATINASLEVVRRILNKCTGWTHPGQKISWLGQAPKITLLDKNKDARPPRPITWAEQANLLPQLPPHLRRMALFVLNTGVRDEAVCALEWDWELRIPELGFSVFIVPPERVKGGTRKGKAQREGLIVCNRVAQGIIEECRGLHKKYVFVWRRERVKNLDQKPAMPYQPITGMLNTAWISACARAGLAGLHVHDLRHTFAVRLREAGVAENTTSDLMWHQRSKSNITAHYSQAQIVELHAALEKIKEDRGQFNKLLSTLRAEANAKRLGLPLEPAASPESPPEGPSPKKRRKPFERIKAVMDAMDSLSPPKVPRQRKRT